MCTLIAAFQQWPEIPLLVAANRDEALARPATGPLVWNGDPCFVAPRDETAGGTWLGLNERGLFVGITNRAGVSAEPSKRSRGLLVTDALRATSAAELSANWKAFDPHAYNPFHLFYADRSAAHLVIWDGVNLLHLGLEPGLHIITERSAQADHTPRGALIRELWADGARQPPVGPAQYIGLLSRHADPPQEGICVHLDAFGYGTRSSAVLWLGESLSHSRLWWAEGPPCRTPFEDRSALLSTRTARGL
jgi:hypothetical protein